MSLPLISLLWTNESSNSTESGKLMCFLSVVPHGKLIKNPVNGGNLSQPTFSLENAQLPTGTSPTVIKLNCYSR